MIREVGHTHLQQVSVSHVQLVWCETLLPLLEVLVVISERYLMVPLRFVEFEATASRHLKLSLLGLLQVYWVRWTHLDLNHHRYVLIGHQVLPDGGGAVLHGRLVLLLEIVLFFALLVEIVGKIGLHDLSERDHRHLQLALVAPLPIYFVEESVFLDPRYREPLLWLEEDQSGD